MEIIWADHWQCLQISAYLWRIQPSDGTETADTETELWGTYRKDGWDQQDAPWYETPSAHHHVLHPAGKISGDDGISAGVCIRYNRRGKANLLLQKHGRRCSDPFLCRRTEEERDSFWMWYDAATEYWHFRYRSVQNIWKSSGKCRRCSKRSAAGK